MSSDLLSQDEIDALLHGVDDGKVDTSADPSALAELARPYDLANQEKVVRGRMPALEVINERFARFMRISLFNLLRHSPDVNVLGVKVMKFNEYVHSLYVPTSMNLVRVRPLRGTGLIVFDSKLVFKLVDRFFGGEGRHAKIEGREFTPTEIRVVQRVLASLFADLKEAWSSIYQIDLDYLGSEVNPSLANVVGARELVVISSFQVELEGGGGELHFTVPYGMIEPIKSFLEQNNQSGTEADSRWEKTLWAHVLRTQVNINCEITEKSMRFRDIQRFKAGDVIPVEMPQHFRVSANQVALFGGTLGESRGNLALRIEGHYQPND